MSKNNLNEPNTGDTVRELRSFTNAEHVNNGVCFLNLNYAEKICSDAALRLESQERTIAEMDVYIELLKEREGALENDAINFEMNLSEMTARAESAERERDAIALELDMMKANETGAGLCLICKKQCGEASNGCFFCKNFEWRGLHTQDKK